jgi:para-aminobenzoate synthetase component 1
VASFEGEIVCARFDDVRSGPWPEAGGWVGPPRAAWASSMDQAHYRAAVEQIRQLIAAGAVYQVNLCRVLSAPIDANDSPIALAHRLGTLNPSPHAGVVDLPHHDVRVVSASPELFLERRGGRMTSRPIKGTAEPGQAFADKDRAENVMIVDLVRNDLGAVARTGSVEVAQLCVREEHPGLSHLVSTVVADLRDEITWADLFEATFPPGSVSGAPKSAALRVIESLEPVARGPYCGAIGWIDADAGTASLGVGIRSFWWHDRHLHLGTGAGITWASDPVAEWRETELKAAHLLASVSR